jgi:hypothetical protein
MKKLLFLLALVACNSATTDEQGNSILGKYICEECPYQVIELQEDGQAGLVSDGVQMSANYSVEEGKLVIETETATYIFGMEKGVLTGEGDLEGSYKKQ